MFSALGLIWYLNILDPKANTTQVGAQFYIKTLVKEAHRSTKLSLNYFVAIQSVSTAGAGSVVTKDVPDYALVVGNWQE